LRECRSERNTRFKFQELLIELKVFKSFLEVPRL
jgi:hypothetical protein